MHYYFNAAKSGDFKYATHKILNDFLNHINVDMIFKLNVLFILNINNHDY